MPPSTPSKIWECKIMIPVDGISVNKEVDVAVDLTSPAVRGRYFSYWRLASPFGQMLGQQVWVHIEMDISQPNSATGGLNPDLNLPPENTSRGWLGTIDAEPFHNVAPKPISSNTSGFLREGEEQGTANKKRWQHQASLMGSSCWRQSFLV